MAPLPHVLVVAVWCARGYFGTNVEKFLAKLGISLYLATFNNQSSTMPLPFLAEVAFKGLPFGLKYWDVARVLAGIALIILVKLYSMGGSNRSERTMYSKVVMITVGC